MKPLDILILAVIAVLLFLAIRYSIRHKHDDCGGHCSGGCASCPYAGKCGKQAPKR
jgi:hypothetical protein